MPVALHCQPQVPPTPHWSTGFSEEKRNRAGELGRRQQTELPSR